MGNGVDLRFLTDEDVPRSTARVLRNAGFDAVDVRDVGLRGKNEEVLRAVKEIGEKLQKQLAIVEIGRVRLRG
ncbi:MAG TPA: DUF5615 family PIN-like protein [Anaerolineales bacterium]|nr:DUF5615 family PIN-like protein [Anaerolineales bacterium]